MYMQLKDVLNAENAPQQLPSEVSWIIQVLSIVLGDFEHIGNTTNNVVILKMLQHQQNVPE